MLDHLVLAARRVVGQVGGGLIGATGTGSRVLSSIGGALGEKFGSQIAESAFGKSLGKLGEQLGPLGAIAGGVLGGPDCSVVVG